MHAGDLFFNGVYPFIDYSTGGNLHGLVTGLGRVLEMVEPRTQVIPGHGPVTNRAGFVKWLADTDAIRNRITAMVREGKTKDDVTKMLVNEFGWDPTGRATTNSIDGMMAEMK